MRRRLFQLALSLVGACAVLLAALTSQRLGAAVQAPLARLLGRSLGQPVVLGSLTGVAFPPGVVLRDLRIGALATADGAPTPLYVQVLRLRLRPHWSTLLLGRLVLAEVLAEGVRVEANLDALAPRGAKNAAPPGPSLPLPLQDRLALPLDVHALALRDASITLTTAQGTVTLPAVGVQTSWRGIGRRALDVQLSEALWTPAGADARAPVPFAATLVATLDGSWARPRHLRLQLARLAAPTLAAQATLSGEVPLARAPSRDALALTGTTTLALAPAWAWLQPAAPAPAPGPVGNATLTLAVTGPLARPDVAWQLAATGLRAGAPASPPPATLPPPLQLQAEGQLHGRAVALTRATLRGQAGGALTATGSLTLTPTLPLQLGIDAVDAPLAAWAEALQGGAPPWQARVTGTLHVDGTLAPLALRTGAALQLVDVALAASPAAAPPGKAPVAVAPVLAMDALGVDAALVVTPDALELASLSLHRQGATLHADGGLHRAGAAGPKGPWTADVRLWAGGMPLQALGPIAGLAYEGVAALAGSLRGPLARPSFEAALDVDHLRVGPVGLGRSHGVLRFAPPMLSLQQFTGQQGGATLQGSGSIVFGRPHNVVRAQVALRDWDAAELLADLQAPSGVVDNLDARLWGELALSGPLDRPEGAAHLKLPRLSFAAVDLGPSELTCTFAEGDARLRATLQAHPGAGELVLHAGLLDVTPRRGPAAVHLKLALQGDRLGLAQLVHTGETPQLDGTLDVRLALEGAPSALDGSWVADVHKLQLAGAQLGGLHLVGRAEAGHASVAVHLLQGSAQLQAKLALAPPFAVHAGATFTDLDARVIEPLLSPAGQRALQDMVLRIHGKAEVDGALAELPRLHGELALAAASLGYGGTQLRLAAPVVLKLRAQRLVVPPTVLLAEATRVVLTGSVPLSSAGALDLQSDVVGDLHALRGFLPGVSNAQGPLQLHVHWRGPLARPEVLGELSLRRAALRFGPASAVQAVDGLQLRALFSGRAVAITDGRAQVGRGRVRFGGEFGLGSDAAAAGRLAGSSLNLRLQLDQVPLAPLPDLSAVLTGGLELGGKLDAPVLRGDIKVLALRYTARLDLNTLVPKRAAPPLRAPLSPFGRPVRLAIKVHAPSDLILSSKVLEAELAAELLVSGTSERVGLLGSVTPLWARARFNENLFTLTHATIDFTDEYRISPSYSVQAHTRACQMEADVLVQGDVDGYSVQPTGRDERGTVDPQDVLTCLNFGLRLSDFDGNRKHSAGLSDALSGSLDALWSVSGLDDKLRKLLPIGVDELRLTSGWSSLSQRTTARVLVGKELGAKVAMRYSRSLDEYNDQAFSLDYRLQPRATLQVNWLSTRDVPVGDFGLDMRLHWELR